MKTDKHGRVHSLEWFEFFRQSPCDVMTPRGAARPWAHAPPAAQPALRSIRASSVPGWLTCPRRAATRPYEVEPDPRPVALEVGSRIHAELSGHSHKSAKRILYDKVTRAEIDLRKQVGAAVPRARQILAENNTKCLLFEIDFGTVYYPSSADADLELTGHVDFLAERAGQLVLLELKTGRLNPNSWSQVAIYAWLLQVRLLAWHVELAGDPERTADFQLLQDVSRRLIWAAMLWVPRGAVTGEVPESAPEEERKGGLEFRAFVGLVAEGSRILAQLQAWCVGEAKGEPLPARPDLIGCYKCPHYPAACSLAAGLHFQPKMKNAENA